MDEAIRMQLPSSLVLIDRVLSKHGAYGTGRWRGEGGMEVGRKGDYIPIATLSSPE